VSRVKISNDNVMYELGIADALLGENRTILLCDENTKIEKLAFDINHKRISPINTNKESMSQELAEWIKIGLMEADKERYTRRYISEVFATDLIVVVNYFFRLAYYSDANYSAGFKVPTVEYIKNELLNNRMGLYMMKADFTQIIKSLEEKMQKLWSFTEKRIIWQIINIVSSLKDYQMYCQSIRYKHLEICEEKEAYCLYDKNSFFLKEGNGVEEIRCSAFFNDNTIICQNMTYNIVLDKRIIVSDEQNSKVQNITLPNGSQQTAVVMNTARVSSKYVDYLSQYIHEILKAVIKFINYCEFEIEHVGADGKNMGIISLKIK
jgi:hypothetical protein